MAGVSLNYTENLHHSHRYYLLVVCSSTIALLASLVTTGVPALPGQREVLLLLFVSAAQFFGQIMLNRGLMLVGGCSLSPSEAG